MKNLHIDKLFYLVLVAFFLIQVFTVFKNNAVWWDEAVYIGLGKYIFSSGVSGLWEIFRPPSLPIIMGLLWKLGLDPVFSGRIVVALLATGIIFLTYLVGRRVFGEKEGVLAAILLAVTPIFFLVSPHLLSDIPSTFFSIAALYIFISRKSNSGLFLSGVLCGLAFLTRFPQILLIVAIILSLFFSEISKGKNLKHIKAIQNSFIVLLGFFLVALPYFLFNYHVYGSALEPLIEANRIIAEEYLWVYDFGYLYYFSALLYQNVFVVFTVFGLIYFTLEKQWRHEKKLAIMLTFLIFVSYFTILIHKELRYTIAFLPYLFILASYGAFKIYSKNRYWSIFIVIFITLSILQTSIQNISIIDYEESSFGKNLAKIDFDKPVFSTTPIVSIYSDAPVKPIYYSLEYAKKSYDTIQNTSAFIIFNTCNLPCRNDDTPCIREKNNLIKKIKNISTVLYYNKEGYCEHYIFKR